MKHVVIDGRPIRTGRQRLHEFAEVSKERPLPADGVHAGRERCGDEIVEAVHDDNSAVIRRHRWWMNF
jgi:hypothetical protein